MNDILATLEENKFLRSLESELFTKIDFMLVLQGTLERWEGKSRCARCLQRGLTILLETEGKC